jgi:microcystin-dependent protein
VARVPVSPVGSIVLWMGKRPPSADWRFCEGEKLSAVDFPKLAAVFGTAFVSSSDGKLTLPTLGDFGPAKHIIRVR